MDPGWPNATAVAIKNGKILSVGSFEDLKPWLNSYPYEIIDTFKDKTIMPGFIELHGHPIFGGIELTRPLLSYFDTLNPYGPSFHGLKTNAAAN
jgi:predicted amidohydrolase YtcJ